MWTTARHKRLGSSTHGADVISNTPSRHGAVLGIEPRTSRTLSENHATKPNSQLKKSVVMDLSGYAGDLLGHSVSWPAVQESRALLCVDTLATCSGGAKK